MPDWVSAGFDEYARRMPREARVELIEIRPERRSAGADPAPAMRREAQRIKAVLPDASLRIALDERGRSMSSDAFARALARWRDAARDIAFLIGGADGLDTDVKSSADALLALSSFTLPHGLARVLLAEQLYRAHTILSGHPYHRS